MTLSRETLVDLNHLLTGFSLSGDRRNSDTRFAIKEASSVLTDLTRALADFSLPSFRPNSDARRILVKEAAKTLSGLQQEIAVARKETKRREMARSLSDLNLALAEFSHAPVTAPLHEIKRSAIAGDIISGWASTFGVLDEQKEVVDPGAFSKCIAEFRGAGNFPKMLWSHNSDEPPIGLWTSLKEDARGLWVEGRILETVRRGAEVLSLIRAGANLGLSIGFRAERARMVSGVRHLQAVDVVEISLCNFPANLDARILIGKESDRRTAVKSLSRERADFSMPSFQ